VRPAPAPPQLSPDGQWGWDGQQWIPAARAAAPAVGPVAVGAVAAGAAGPAGGGVADLVGLDDLWESESEHLSADDADGTAAARLLLGLLWLCGVGSAVAVLVALVLAAAVG
jgi:hypothetical protein